ncbi:MAG: hypothetical protein RLZZ139_771 [Cyanobacteriota bacterium]|jgi:hypothetical protein
MTDFKHMNSPLEADFAIGNLDRLLTRAKADIKTTVGAVKDIASKAAWKDPKKNASYTDLGKGASEAKGRANKALKDKNEANKAAEREKTAKDTTLKYVEPRKPRAVAGAGTDKTQDFVNKVRKENKGKPVMDESKSSASRDGFANDKRENGKAKPISKKDQIKY